MVLMASHSLPFFCLLPYGKASGRASAEGVHVHATHVRPGLQGSHEGQVPAPGEEPSIAPHAQTPYRFFTWTSPLFSARLLTSSTLCALELPTKLQCSYYIMTHEAPAKAVAETEVEAVGKAAAHHDAEHAASEGMAAAAQRC